MPSEEARAQRHVDELYEYAKLIGADGRVRAILPYTYDGNRQDWANFDIRTEIHISTLAARIAREGLPQPGQPPIVNPPPVVPPPVVPPAPRIVGQIVSRAPNAGTSYVFGKAWQSGVTVHYAWRGNPSLAQTVTAGYQDWAPGYYSFPLYVNGVTPCAGEWDIWCTDGVRTSARVPFATSGPGGGINQVEIDFALVQAPPPAGITLPEQEPVMAVGKLADKCRWWLEESIRRDEAGDAERAKAIRYSLIKLDGGLFYRLERALKAGKPTG